MRSHNKILALCALLGAATALAAPANAQVMARGYWNHVESRVSFFIPEVTQADQVTTETIDYAVDGNEPMVIPAFQHTFIGRGGTIYKVTSVDFAPYYEPHNSTVQYSMMDAATKYRQKGEVILDAGTRSDRIPAHILNVELPNGNTLFTVFMLHQNDDMNERRLVIAEAETPPGGRQPALFLASIGIINPEFFGTDADHTLWRVRYSPAGPPIHGQELVATQPWGVGEFEEVMSAGGEEVPEEAPAQ